MKLNNTPTCIMSNNHDDEPDAGIVSVFFSVLCNACTHRVLVIFVLSVSCMSADSLVPYTIRKEPGFFFVDNSMSVRKEPGFFFIDNSMSPEGRLFSNSVYLDFVNSNRIDVKNCTVTISEVRRMNSSTIVVSVNEIWNYQLQLPRKSEAFEEICAEVVSFLWTAVTLSNFEKQKSR